MTQPPDRTGKTGSEDLARVVRERREALGLTRQELADATGIPYPTIAQIETAYRGVSPARLGVIARVLGLDPKELYEVLASEEPEAPAAVRSRPAPLAAAAPVAAPAPAGAPAAGSTGAGSWHANPRFAAARSSSRRGRKAPTRAEPEVSEQILALLATLPVDQRLSALAEIQQQVMDQVVQERVERGG